MTVFLGGSENNRAIVTLDWDTVSYRSHTPGIYNISFSVSKSFLLAARRAIFYK